MMVLFKNTVAFLVGTGLSAAIERPASHIAIAVGFIVLVSLIEMWLKSKDKKNED